MKKLFALVAIMTLVSLGSYNVATALPQDEVVENPDSTLVEDPAADPDSTAAPEAVEPEATPEPEAAAEGDGDAEAEEGDKQEIQGIHQSIKKNFIEGGPQFMVLVLICLILGLALCIERIVYLNLSSTNTKKLLASLEDALKRGGVDAAKDVCRNTPGPVASIFYQGLDRSSESIAEVEKSIEQYGGVQMGLLERGLSWISLFIAIAPMLGFMGTVIGMIQSFNDIEAANTMNAQLVAGGIKVALITTVSGLIVAILLQIFYNYILSKIDGIVLDMEEASIELVDMLYEHQLLNK
jgi:biopolymer transport protein ExbB